MSAPGGRRAARDARSVTRRRRHERILAAATELFAERGFAKTTVDEIAGIPFSVTAALSSVRKTVERISS